MKKFLLYSITVFLLFVTGFSIVQAEDAKNIKEVVDGITDLLAGSVVYLMFALAMILFFWGVVQFMANSEDETKRDKGKQFMIWGLVGLTVMFGVYGFVKIIGSVFGVELKTNVLPQAPAGNN